MWFCERFMHLVACRILFTKPKMAELTETIPMTTRRQVLMASGICIALPELESACCGATVTAAPQKRMVCISSALGMNPEAFFPSSFERGYELSPTLKSLESLRNDFTVISHMDHPGIYTKHGAMNSLLSGVDAKKAGPGENISVDQVAAASVGYQTRFPSALAPPTPLALTGIHDLVTLSGSLVLGLAVARGALAADEGWTLSRIDETWQAEQWGRDAEAEEAAERKRAEFLQARKLLDLL